MPQYGIAQYGIVLGGGRSQRMGTNKLLLHSAGRSLLANAAFALTEHLSLAGLVIAGPQPQQWDGPPAKFVVEDPPFGGPVAGMSAAVSELVDAPDAALVWLLAGDLAEPGSVVVALNNWLGENWPQLSGLDGSQGVVLQDAQGWAQYLAGCYKLGGLRQGLARLDGVRDVSVRRLMREIPVVQFSTTDVVMEDIDTPEAARRHGIVETVRKAYNCNENGA